MDLLLNIIKLYLHLALVRFDLLDLLG